MGKKQSDKITSVQKNDVTSTSSKPDMMFKRLNIIQVNLHKAKLATVELTKLFLDADFNGQGRGGKVNADKPGVMLVQELYVQYNGKLFNEGWNAVHHNMGRVAILVNNGVNHWPVQNFASRDCVVTTIKLMNSNNEAKILYLASVYLDRLKPPISGELKAIVEHCKNKGLPLIIGMDSNAHSHEWGSDEDNDRAIALSEYFDQNQLFVTNRGDKPTFKTKRRKSITDLTVTNSSAIDLSIEEWEVLDTHNFSDHKYIKFSVGEYTPFKKCFRNFKKANLEYFKSNLENYPQQIDVIDCVE